MRPAGIADASIENAIVPENVAREVTERGRKDALRVHRDRCRPLDEKVFLRNNEIFFQKTLTEKANPTRKAIAICKT